MFSLWRFILPIAFWLFLMRDFLLGIIPVNMDTNTIYGVVKYYFNNLANGVVPLWEPFIDLGRPFYALAICNLFNPVTHLVLLLKFLGVNYYAGFLTYITVYFLIGCAGFYWLAKEIFKDKNWAYVAFVAFLFSSVGPSIFTQLTFIEILVPAIWFFFFLLRFAHEQNKLMFLGLSYSLMMVLVSYLPFYFVAVAGIFVLLCGLLYPRYCWQFICKTASFKLKNKWLVICCTVGLLVAALPLLVYKLIDASGDVVAPGRHCQYSSQQECYERTMNNQGGMSYEEITRSGSLGERMDVGYLFTHLDKITYGSDSLFFIPVMIFLLIGLGLFLRADRVTVMLVGMILLITLIGLGDAAPLYRWLYAHVPFLGYFRNLFFFGIFLIPLVILLGVRSLQGLMNLKLETVSARKGAVIGVLLLHLLFIILLRRYEGILISTWVTVALSAVFFTARFIFGNRFNAAWGVGIITMLMIIQPAQIIAAYAANAMEFRGTLPSMHVTPEFNWVRPDKPQVSTSRIYQFVPYEDFWYAMNMSDATAHVGYPQSAARWTFEASQQIGSQALADYARYKIYVVDNLAGPLTPILSPSERLQVKLFDVNRLILKTDLLKAQWVIYNDSYTSHWKAFVNGHEAPLARANIAFKAVHVPMGEAVVEFRYCPPGGQWVYVLTAVALFIFCAGILFYMRIQRNKGIIK